jgi:lysyl-tRNA synthetase class 2
MTAGSEEPGPQQNHHHKLEALRASGEDPFKLSFSRSHTADQILTKYTGLVAEERSGEQVRVAGRIMSLRRLGRVAFAVLQDYTGRIQLFADAASLGDRLDGFAGLDVGDWTGAAGEVVATKTGEISVHITDFELLTKCLRPWPDKFHGVRDVERRYRQRYLDLATNPRAREIMLARSTTVEALRSWLSERDFVEVETPMLQPQPGGAIARPFVTHHEVLGIDMYLRIAPELYLKRLLIGGVERVFEINRNFRNEGVSVKYNPEFTMLELYQAFADYHDMAELMEGMIRHTATEVNGSRRVTFQGTEIDFDRPFRRVRLIDLVSEAGVDVDGDLAGECDRIGVPYDPKWPWGKLLVEIYEKKVEPTIAQPTFVMDFPLDVSPLARTHRYDPRFTEHFDLLIGGIEIGPAYSELTDPGEQRKRFEAQAQLRLEGDAEAHLVDEDFLNALEYGMPPAGGLGMGIDRLVMVLTDSASIREVILFPALRPEA